MMGSGKSTIAKELNTKLELPIIDSDSAIEKDEQMSISDMFSEYGEDYFRDREKSYLENYQYANSILSTGGGMIIQEENRLRLKTLGTVIYLKGTVDTLYNRLYNETSDRPLIDQDLLKNQLNSLLQRRKDWYELTADLEISIDDKTAGEVVAEIILNLKELGYNF